MRRYLWISGVAVVALLGAGCSSSPSSSKTTTSHTTTTAPTHAVSDTAVCTKFKSFIQEPTASQKAATANVIKELERADNPKLRREASYWNNAVAKKNVPKAEHAQKRITQLCGKKNLATTTTTAPTT
jgi:hypothetical protein